MQDFSTNRFQKENFIVFYEEVEDYINVYYADGREEHFPNTQYIKELLKEKKRKQIYQAKDIIEVIDRDCESYKTENFTDLLYFFLTFLTSINVSVEHIGFSLFLLIMSLVTIVKRRYNKEIYEDLYALRYDYLKCQFFLEHEEDFKEMDFSDPRLYRGVNKDALMFILLHGEEMQPFNINTISLISFKDLVRIVDNYHNVILAKQDRALVMEKKDEKKN